MTATARAQAGDGGDERRLVQFAPIRQARAHEYVAEQIRRQISLRLLPPGRALPPERDMARQFGVGRPTIQLALRLLEAEQLVEVRRGRRGGTFVARPREDQAAKDGLVARVLASGGAPDELLALRRLLEPGVAQLAAEVRRAHDLRAMRRVLKAMTTTASEPDYMRLDTEFHLALAAATRNRFVVDAIDGLRRGLHDVMCLLPESELWHDRIDEEHRMIVEAVAERDGDAAADAMRRHVANADQAVLAVLATVRRTPRRARTTATAAGGSSRG